MFRLYMLGERRSHRGLSTMGNTEKVGDQLGLRNHNRGYKKKSIIPANKDIAQNEQLSRFEPVHVFRKNKSKKSHLEK